MAIAKISKIEIIGLHEDKERFLNLLQRLGIVELISVKDETYQTNPPLFSENLPISIEAEILEIEEEISYLATFKEKTRFFEGIANLRPIIYENELKEIIASFDYRSVLKELKDLRSHLKNVIQHKEKLEEEKHLLLP